MLISSQNNYTIWFNSTFGCTAHVRISWEEHDCMETKKIHVCLNLHAEFKNRGNVLEIIWGLSISEFHELFNVRKLLRDRESWDSCGFVTILMWRNSLAKYSESSFPFLDLYIFMNTESNQTWGKLCENLMLHIFAWEPDAALILLILRKYKKKKKLLINIIFSFRRINNKINSGSSTDENKIVGTKK